MVYSRYAHIWRLKWATHIEMQRKYTVSGFPSEDHLHGIISCWYRYITLSFIIVISHGAKNFVVFTLFTNEEPINVRESVGSFILEMYM